MKRRIFFITLGLAIIIVGVGAGVLWAFTHSSKIATRVIDAALPSDSEQQTISAIVPRVLGFDYPNTVLFLFLNNTELRPGGGFLGSYGLVTFDHGVPTSIKITDTQVFDAAAPATFIVEPPAPLKTYLAQPRWFFRDANWSPDFVISAQRMLQFYAAEGGEAADQIHTVIAITPQVLSRIMKYTGAIKIDGVTFTDENIGDVLQHSVEVGFLEKQIPTNDRKKIMNDLARELAARIAKISPLQWGALLDDAFALTKERHIMLYDIDPNVQRTLDTLGWSGRMLPGEPDKLQIVDANLAALKTDRVIERAAEYSLTENSNGLLVGTVKLRYKHTGTFDWRTTRYRSYVRVFLPLGSNFLNGEGAMQAKGNKPGDFTTQIEDGFVSVGAFVSVEPGTTKTISFQFMPSPKVQNAVDRGWYGLAVQKQLGLPQFHLTIHHNFGKNIEHASPPEAPKFFGDRAYDWEGDVKIDQLFFLDW